MQDRHIFIIKADGTRQEFDERKLNDSLVKAGAKADVREKIARHISGEIRDGMSTSMIYKHAYELLHKFERPVAARYSLKRAVAELGPSGFPFEKFIAEIFKARGFKTLLDQEVKGKCSMHEMDVVAWNENRLIMIEAKFHNEQGIKSDLKVALYIKARFDDLAGQRFNYGRERTLDEGILITNTNFTNRAIEYSACSGVRLLGWNYPESGSLHDIIVGEGLHPITCLNSLSNLDKKNLLENGIVLCRGIRERKDDLAGLGISDDLADRAEKESLLLCPSLI